MWEGEKIPSCFMNSRYNLVNAIVQGKYYRGPIRWRRKATVLESIVFSYTYLEHCTYFAFSEDGENLLSCCILDSSTAYLVQWKYAPHQRLLPLRCLHCVKLKCDQPLSTAFSIAECEHSFLVSYFVEPSFPTYHLSISLIQQNITVIYHSQYPCNHPSHFQMDSRLITYTPTSCCSLLPYPNEFEIFICETNTANSHSDSLDVDWKAAQSRRFLQESKFPILFSAKSNLSFLSSASHHRWFSITYPHPQSPVVLTLSLFSISDRGVDAFSREFHNETNGIKVTIGNVSIAELCAACFPSTFIHFFAYSIIQSYLCHARCVVPHVQLACLVQASSLRGSGQRKDCYWLVLELCFHSSKTAEMTENAYAVVLEKKQIELESEEFAMQRREMGQILENRVKFLSTKLTEVWRGKPAMHCFRSEQGKPVVVVNPRYGDVLYTVSSSV